MTNASGVKADETESRDAGRPAMRAAGVFWDDLHGTTIKLAVVFWVSVLINDSVMWGLAGFDPIESLPGKLVVNSFGICLAMLISWALLRARRAGLLLKTLLAFVLSAFASTLTALADFEYYRWHMLPQVVEFDTANFGYTLISSTSTFFGWSCLYIALVYSFDLRDRERKLAAAREEAFSAQMRALRYQVNPHFLFNTLNSIAALIEEGAVTRAERMVMSLSTFLRSTLELDPLGDVPLGEELALQEDYLEIERERFSDRMHFSINIDAATRQALVPSFILQPLIENAIKHGVGRSSRQVGIHITAWREADSLRITVENGLGQDRPPPPGSGIGLRNVSQRIAARFGAAGQLIVGAADGAVYRVELQLPWRVA